MGRNEDEFRQERLLEMSAKMPIPKAGSGLSGMDFEDYGDEETHPYTRYFFALFSGNLYRAKKRRNKRQVK